jgi:hypothetical protein
LYVAGIKVIVWLYKIKLVRRHNHSPMQLVQIEQTGTSLSSVLSAGSVAAEVVAATVALYTRRGYEPP